MCDTSQEEVAAIPVKDRAVKLMEDFGSMPWVNSCHQWGQDLAVTTTQASTDAFMISKKALALNDNALAHAELGDALRSDANQVLLQVTRNEGVEEYTQPYIIPAWGPLDTVRHREVVLRWLARRWNIAGWKSGCLPPRSPSRSFMSELCPELSPAPQQVVG
eukprot:Skav231334  [mRNA]  locus=scaffold2490:33866:45010:- [translate_table: standard]